MHPPARPGAGRPRVAARAVKAGVLLGLLTTLACVIPIALVPRAVARLFTHDEQVRACRTRARTWQPVPA